MFGSFSPKMKGGLTRLQQAFTSGITYVIRGPIGAVLRIDMPRSQGAAPSIEIVAGNAGVSALQAAGSVSISSGANDGGHFQASTGSISITTPTTTNAQGGSGGITISCGSGGSSGGGAINITAGIGTAGNAGACNISAGSASGGTVGGITTISGGAAGAGGAQGGDLRLRGGAGGANGGSVNIQPGSGGLGNIQLDGGRGAALSTSATNGFVTVPTCAGAPTGVPANVPTGSVATVVDTTNLRAYFYIAGTWRYAQLI